MPEFPLHIQGNNVINREEVVKNFKRLEDGYYMVRMTKGTKRSLAQNSYYWSTVLETVRHGLVDIGYREIRNNDEVHELLKAMFLKKKVVNELSGEEIAVSGSTTKLSKQEFSEYIDEVAKWSSEYLGVFIPAPNQSANSIY